MFYINCIILCCISLNTGVNIPPPRKRIRNRSFVLGGTNINRGSLGRCCPVVFRALMELCIHQQGKMMWHKMSHQYAAPHPSPPLIPLSPHGLPVHSFHPPFLFLLLFIPTPSPLPSTQFVGKDTQKKPPSKLLHLWSNLKSYLLTLIVLQYFLLFVWYFTSLNEDKDFN